MADLLFRVGCVLEHGGCRIVRIHDQSTDRSLLHARTQYDACPWACCALRRVRHVGNRVNADVPPRLVAKCRMERRHAEVCILVHEYWTHGDGSYKPVAGGPDANMGIGGEGLLVCAE